MASLILTWNLPWSTPNLAKSSYAFLFAKSAVRLSLWNGFKEAVAKWVKLLTSIERVTGEHIGTFWLVTNELHLRSTNAASVSVGSILPFLSLDCQKKGFYDKSGAESCKEAHGSGNLSVKAVKTESAAFKDDFSSILRESCPIWESELSWSNVSL